MLHVQGLDKGPATAQRADQVHMRALPRHRARVQGAEDVSWLRKEIENIEIETGARGYGDESFPYGSNREEVNAEIERVARAYAERALRKLLIDDGNGPFVLRDETIAEALKQADEDT
jgi:hypothetical protein